MRYWIVLAALFSVSPAIAATCTTGDERCVGKNATEDGGDNCEMEPNQPMRFCNIDNRGEDFVSCACRPIDWLNEAN